MNKTTPETHVLSPETLQTSGALLTAHTALSRSIQCDVVDPAGHDATVIDLLVRLDQAAGGRLRAVDLSRELLMSPSHISRVIDRAEHAGLVSRLADPTDRRASQVELTHEGREVLIDLAPRFEAVIDRVIDQTLTQDEAATLRNFLGRITRAAHGDPAAE